MSIAFVRYCALKCAAIDVADQPATLLRNWIGAFFLLPRDRENELGERCERQLLRLRLREPSTVIRGSSGLWP